MFLNTSTKREISRETGRLGSSSCQLSTSTVTLVYLDFFSLGNKALAALWRPSPNSWRLMCLLQRSMLWGVGGGAVLELLMLFDWLTGSLIISDTLEGLLSNSGDSIWLSSIFQSLSFSLVMPSIMKWCWLSILGFRSLAQPNMDEEGKY